MTLATVGAPGSGVRGSPIMNGSLAVRVDPLLATE